jgi:SOS-response transcriptional repressor LexA
VFPSFREIVEAFGFHSPNAANRHLVSLFRKRYLRKGDPSSARSIRLLLADGAEVHRIDGGYGVLVGQVLTREQALLLRDRLSEALEGGEA